MKIITTLLLTAIFIINIHAQDESIYFDSDQHHIRTSENAKLSNIRKQYSEGDYKILLIGHCDMAGSDSYNVILSEKRANSVRQYLIRQQIPAEDIQMEFQGETQARQIAETYRKVEIFLISKASEKKEMTYDGFMESIKPKQQTFKFIDGKTNTIEGEKGTVIRIPENAFVYENGKPPTDEIVFKLIEYNSKKEFVSEGLSTMSNGRLLESAGMIHLEATCLDKPLKLAAGTKLEISFPEIKDGYSIFFGKRDEDGIMNWEPRKLTWNDLENDPVLRFGDDAIYYTGDSYLDSLARGSKADLEKAHEIWDEQQRQKRLLLKSGRLGFINCDRFVNGKDVVEIDYTIAVENKHIDAVAAFFIMKDINSVIEIKQQSKTTFGINAKIPVGANVQVIVTGKDGNDKLYLFENTFELKEKEEQKVRLSKNSYARLDQLLE